MKQILVTLGLVIALVANLQAQGPPITSDKTIMLSEGNVVVKTLTEIRNTNAGTFLKTPLMVHYIVHPKVLLGVHLPMVNHQFKNNILGEFDNGWAFGDVELLGKYQFFRKDQMAKTLRMVAKTVQTLPTGKMYRIENISTGTYQSYLAWVLGYETIKYGISSEIGYNITAGNMSDELMSKFGVGLPLLKPTYPVKQINLYFEYKSIWQIQNQAYELLYAQGVQYAIKQLTIEAAIQFPLISNNNVVNPRNNSIFLGTRYVF